MRRSLAFVFSFVVVINLCASDAHAVGWDRDDFIITGAPNFPDRIGIFDHDFTFKGYLEQNFVGVQGMDFDAQGNLVAVASLSTNPEVRVYSPSGTQIGGFLTNDPGLQFTGDLKVAPNGNYALGSFTNGVRVFTPQGAFVRQYGAGDSRGITYVPGNRLWSGGAGNTVTIYDADTGAQTGTFVANGQTMSYSMQYNTVTNTVLIVDGDRDLGGIFERNLIGQLMQDFHVPIPQTDINGATWGPGGNVFGTTDDFALDVVRWNSDGTVGGTRDVYPSNVTAVRILWGGLVPEPDIAAVLVAMSAGLCTRRPIRSCNRSPR